MQQSCKKNKLSIINRIFKWLMQFGWKIGMQTYKKNYEIVG